jgi:hypothetical protein
VIARSAKLAGLMLAVCAVFIALTELSDVVIFGEPLAVDQQQWITAALVSVLIVFWRTRRERRARTAL